MEAGEPSKYGEERKEVIWCRVQKAREACEGESRKVGWTR